MSASPDGRQLVTCGAGGAAVFDVVGFDMILMVKLATSAALTSVAWYMPAAHAKPCFVVGDASGLIHVVDVGSGSASALAVHRSYVTAICYVPALRALLSFDAKGLAEVWQPGADGRSWALPAGAPFAAKSATDLYELARRKTFAVSAAVCADKIAVFCADSHLRVLRAPSLRLLCEFDEDPALQHAPPGLPEDPLDTGRRVALHRQLLA